MFKNYKKNEKNSRDINLDKNFDIKTMVKILRERIKPKNKIMHQIQFKKIEEKHQDFIRMVENNEIEVKKVRKYYYKLRSKNKY